MVNELKFYRKQGKRTRIKKGTFNKFPDDLKKVCKIIQGLLVHPDSIEHYGLDLTAGRVQDRYIKTVQAIVNRLQQIENKDLMLSRLPKNRILNNCRHFAMFFCSVLREKGIPARCRCGFATYLETNWFEDHWICEFYDKDKKEWKRVDPMIDKLHIEMCNIKGFNQLDLAVKDFYTGGGLWVLYRQGKINPGLCGFSLEEGESGEWYIRGNLLRDFFALNKMEYTYQELSKLMDRNYKPSEEELELLDRIATLIAVGDLEGIMKFYKDNKFLIPTV